MDSNSNYNEQGRLTVRDTYYGVGGMLYQIVPRVIEELKIIVLGNPSLFVKLLEIKHGTFIKSRKEK